MSKKKTKKISSTQKLASDSNDVQVKENHIQKENTSWQKWGTIINLIIALSSLAAIYISYDTAKKSLKNAEIANETSQQSLKAAQDANEKSLKATQDANDISRQSLKVAQDANEKSLKATQDANDISRNSLKVAQEANEKSLKATQDANDISLQSLKVAQEANETSRLSLKASQESIEVSRQSLKLAEDANRIQVLPVIETHPKTIKDLLSEERKANTLFNIYDIDQEENKESNYEKLGLVFSNIGKPLLSKPSCEIIDYYRIRGTLNNHPEHTFSIIHDWFIPDTSIKHSTSETMKDNMTSLQGTVFTIKFRKDNFMKDYDKLDTYSLSGRLYFSDEDKEKRLISSFSISKFHLIKLSYNDVLGNNYHKYILKTTKKTDEFYAVLDENDYNKHLAKLKEKQYPDIVNQNNIHHVTIEDFWEKIDFSKTIPEATPQLFKWFWTPNKQHIVSYTYTLKQKIPKEQIDQVIDKYFNAIK